MHRSSVSFSNALLVIAALTALSTGITGTMPGLIACAQQADSKYAKLDAALQQATKRGKPAEEADALYDLAKAHFENSDPARAEELMRQSLEKEKQLQRPAPAVRTRVALAAILVALRKVSEAM